MQVALPGLGEPLSWRFWWDFSQMGTTQPQGELQSLFLMAKMFPVSPQKAAAFGCLAVNCIVLLYCGTSRGPGK